MQSNRWWRIKIKASFECEGQECYSPINYRFFFLTLLKHFDKHFSSKKILLLASYLYFSLTLSGLSVEKDWEDIKFGVDNEVDFYAVSFVKDAKVIHELKDYLRSKC